MKQAPGHGGARGGAKVRLQAGVLHAAHPRDHVRPHGGSPAELLRDQVDRAEHQRLRSSHPDDNGAGGGHPRRRNRPFRRDGPLPVHVRAHHRHEEGGSLVGGVRAGGRLCRGHGRGRHQRDRDRIPAHPAGHRHLRHLLHLARRGPVPEADTGRGSGGLVQGLL